MVVESGLGGIDPPMARHAEVKDQSVAAIGADQPEFRPATEAGDGCAREPLPKVERKRPAQVEAARLDPGQAPAVEDSGQAADGGLDFGKLGHRRRYGEPTPRRLEARTMTAKVNFGDEQVSPDEKTRRVAAVFSSVARRYDLMNDLMSGGLHHLWKDRFVSRVKPRTGEQILDMAGGTGDVAFRMARRGAQVTVVDINPDMLEVGRERAERRGIAGLEWRVENAEAL